MSFEDLDFALGASNDGDNDIVDNIIGDDNVTVYNDDAKDADDADDGTGIVDERIDSRVDPTPDDTGAVKRETDEDDSKEPAPREEQPLPTPGHSSQGSNPVVSPVSSFKPLTTSISQPELGSQSRSAHVSRESVDPGEQGASASANVSANASASAELARITRLVGDMNIGDEVAEQIKPEVSRLIDDAINRIVHERTRAASSRGEARVSGPWRDQAPRPMPRVYPTGQHVESRVLSTEELRDRQEQKEMERKQVERLRQHEEIGLRSHQRMLETSVSGSQVGVSNQQFIHQPQYTGQPARDDTEAEAIRQANEIPPLEPGTCPYRKPGSRNARCQNRSLHPSMDPVGMCGEHSINAGGRGKKYCMGQSYALWDLKTKGSLEQGQSLTLVELARAVGRVVKTDTFSVDKNGNVKVQMTPFSAFTQSRSSSLQPQGFRSQSFGFPQQQQMQPQGFQQTMQPQGFPQQQQMQPQGFPQPGFQQQQMQPQGFPQPMRSQPMQPQPVQQQQMQPQGFPQPGFQQQQMQPQYGYQPQQPLRHHYPLQNGQGMQGGQLSGESVYSATFGTRSRTSSKSGREFHG